MPATIHEETAFGGLELDWRYCASLLDLFRANNGHSDYYTNYYMKRPKFNWSGPAASWLALPTPH